MFNVVVKAWQLVPEKIRKKLFFVYLLNLILIVTEIFGLSLILPILSLVVQPELIDKFVFISSAMGFLSINTNEAIINILLVLMLVMVCVKNIGAALISRWQFKFLANEQAEISKWFFNLYIRMPYSEFLKRDIGYFTYAINSISAVFYSSAIQQILIILTEVTTLLFLLTALFILNGFVTFYVVIVLSIFGAVIFLFTSRTLREIGESNRVKSESSIRIIKETFTSLKEIRVLRRGGRFEKKYKSVRDELSKNQASQLIYTMYTRHLLEISLVIIIVFVAYLTISNNQVGTAIGQLSLFGIISFRILPSATRIISGFQIIKTAEATIDFYYSEKSAADSWCMEKSDRIGSGIPDNNLSRINIQLVNVSFKYQGEHEFALKNISMNVEHGSVIGIVGDSGAGKSTLVDLILGLHKPTSGEILFNGKNIIDDICEWRKHVAYVPQNIGFINGTIKQNVAFGLDDNEIDENNIMSSLREAQVIDKINNLSAGIDYVITDAASTLSGGEKQRIGLARAIYQKASVLILDEATSALDVMTEKRITDFIEKQKGVRTVFIIAHRLSTLKHCQNILYLRDGKVNSMDTFLNLYQKNQYFKKMVDVSKLKHSEIF